MKKILLLLTLFFVIQINAQNVTFTFLGKNSITENPIQVDKVTVINETNGTDTVITGNTLSLVFTSINLNDINSESRLYSYPNPFNREVTLTYNSTCNEKIMIEVYNIEGKIITNWSGIVGTGESKFLLKSNVEGLLFLSVISNRVHLHSKLLCLQKNTSDELQIITNSSYSVKSAQITSDGSFSYRRGDLLRFIGYSGLVVSEEITDTPEGSTNYTFIFNVSDYVPSADFYAANTNINQGENASFTDLSTKSPANWLWDFGDGGTSTTQNPTHTYLIPGTFTVSLTASNTYGPDTEIKSNYITVNSMKPEAEFIAFVTSINKGDSITFYDQSTNSPTSWNWNFGDGDTSTVQNPTHQFGSSGKFTITFIALNNFGADTITKTDYINVLEGPNLNIKQTELFFDSITTQLSFNLENTGSDTLNWTISENLDWLVLNPNSGSNTTETNKITVTVDRSGLFYGSYSGIITVTSNGGSQNISIKMEVPEYEKAVVETSNPENISSSGVTLGGNVISDGGTTVTERGIVYSASQNPTTSDNNVIIGAGTGLFSAKITLLAFNTNYYVRAYATNSAGTVYGNQVSFVTPLNPAVALMINKLSNMITYFINYNTDLMPNNPTLVDLLQAKIDMLKDTTLESDIKSDSRIIADEVISINGKQIPIVVIFPLEDMREEAIQTVLLIKSALQVLEKFMDTPSVYSVIEIWYGFKLGMTGGTHGIQVEDRKSYELRTGTDRLPYEAIIYHEMGHSYIGNESLTQFLEIYVYNLVNTNSFNLGDWIFKRGCEPMHESNQYICAILDLYQLLGREKMSDAYKILGSLIPPYGLPLSEEAKQAFIDQAPTELKNQIREKVDKI